MKQTAAHFVGVLRRVAAGWVKAHGLAVAFLGLLSTFSCAILAPLPSRPRAPFLSRFSFFSFFFPASSGRRPPVFGLLSCGFRFLPCRIRMSFRFARKLDPGRAAEMTRRIAPSLESVSSCLKLPRGGAKKKSRGDGSFLQVFNETGCGDTGAAPHPEWVSVGGP